MTVGCWLLRLCISVFHLVKSSYNFNVTQLRIADLQRCFHSSMQEISYDNKKCAIIISDHPEF